MSEKQKAGSNPVQADTVHLNRHDLVGVAGITVAAIKGELPSRRVCDSLSRARDDGWET